MRRIALERFPFILGFVVGPPSSVEPLLLVVLAHDKRRPGYWFGRTKRRSKRAVR